MQAARWLVSPLLSAVGILKKPKAAAAAEKPLPIVTRDSVREAADRNDELRRRRGGAADIVGGAFGAEPLAGAVGKATLGS